MEKFFGNLEKSKNSENNWKSSTKDKVRIWMEIEQCSRGLSGGICMDVGMEYSVG